MTNKEILQADMLDILFEHRNKLYGAYALRKTYRKRLGLSLGLALSITLLFLMSSFINKNKSNGGVLRGNIDSLQLIDVNLKPDEPEPEKPKPEVKPPQAQVDYQPPTIVEDDQVKDDLPELDDIIDAKISDINAKGEKPTDIVESGTESTGNGSVPEKEEPKVDSKPVIPNRNPQFPGGPQAWLAFLQRYLQSPEDLEPGQRIEVMVRFLIDVDGSISKPEIIKSGGSAFDKEVLRVLKKMPKWEAAIQNGIFVAVPYTQPVIFIGVEQ